MKKPIIFSTREEGDEIVREINERRRLHKKEGYRFFMFPHPANQVGLDKKNGSSNHSDAPEPRPIPPRVLLSKDYSVITPVSDRVELTGQGDHLKICMATETPEGVRASVFRVGDIFHLDGSVVIVERIGSASGGVLSKGREFSKHFFH